MRVAAARYPSPDTLPHGPDNPVPTLERRTASSLDEQAAVFFPAGTMVLQSHCTSTHTEAGVSTGSITATIASAGTSPTKWTIRCDPHGVHDHDNGMRQVGSDGEPYEGQVIGRGARDAVQEDLKLRVVQWDTLYMHG
jgi:hypothetical protein